MKQCTVCKCTEWEPCNPPCAWATERWAAGLCGSCADLVGALIVWQDVAHKPSLAALVRTVQAHLARPTLMAEIHEIREAARSRMLSAGAPQQPKKRRTSHA